jgi:hypothetical protein
MVVGTLCAVILIVMIGLTLGLYTPLVDNNKIFAIFGDTLKNFGGAIIAVVSYTLGRSDKR